MSLESKMTDLAAALESNARAMAELAAAIRASNPVAEPEPPAPAAEQVHQERAENPAPAPVAPAGGAEQAKQEPPMTAREVAAKAAAEQAAPQAQAGNQADGIGKPQEAEQADYARESDEDFRRRCYALCRKATNAGLYANFESLAKGYCERYSVAGVSRIPNEARSEFIAQCLSLLGV